MTPTRPDVLLVSLDTVRADVAFREGFAAFDELTRRGMRYRSAISSSPLTPVSHSTVLTGLLPPRHGVRHMGREQLAPTVPTLATILGENGYETAAVVACAALDSWYGLGRGFDSYDDAVPGAPATPGKPIKRAVDVVDAALTWLVARPRTRPFFLFCHFFDAHAPYVGEGSPTQRYEAEIAYLQPHLARLLASADAASGKLVVAVFADHGEDLAGGYPNDQGAAHPEEEGHGCLVNDATMHVPLWIVAPDRPGATDVFDQVGLVDIAPTILDLAIIDGPPMDGRSLIRGRSPLPRVAYSETLYPEERGPDAPGGPCAPLKAVRIDGRYKVVWHHNGDVVEVFDLHCDPLERSPVRITP